MTEIGLGHYLTLGAVIFSIGIIGIFLNRKNIIVILMSICGIPSKSAWKIIQQGCDAVLKISDTDTKKAIKKLYYPKGGDPKIVSGESGAAGLAGLLKVINNKELYELKSYLNLNKDSKILLFNTEGDTDENSFKKIISN